MACGGDVKLRLGFSLPEGEAALSTTSRVELAASRDGARVAFVTSAYNPGVSLALDEVDKDGAPLTLTLTGRNTGGAPTAFGTLGPPATSAIADAGETCCLTMCVCSVTYHDSNACDCGSAGCDPCE